jgi:transposase
MSKEKSIGIDVSKDTLEVFESSTGELQTFGNNRKGIKKLVRYIQESSPDITTIETTGKYHRQIARTLYDGGFSILLAQPKRVRDFARGLGILAKTDPLDAKCIALYGLKCDLEPSTLITPEEEDLKDLVSRREQLNDLIRMEKNRLSSASKVTEVSTRRMIRHIKREIDQVALAIKKQLRCCEGAKKKIDIILSAKGVGDVVAAILVSHLPELGTMTKREVASLCGLAPFNHDSGRLRGKRSIYGGRAIVRSALYMASLSASRFDPVFAKDYQRLLSNGKNKRLALTAIMRKMAVRLNAMVREETPCRHSLAK